MIRSGEFREVVVRIFLAPHRSGGVAQTEAHGGDAGGRVAFLVQTADGMPAVAAAEDGTVPAVVEMPTEAAGQPAEKLQRGEPVARGVGDVNAVEAVEARQRGGQVEDLGHGVAQVEEACPVEIAECGARTGKRPDFLQDTELRGGGGPRVAVDDEPVDPAPESRVRIGMQVALPPEVERQVGVEVGEDDAGQATGGGPVELERELFGTDFFFARFAQMAVGGDPRVDAGSFGVRLSLHEERAEGVVGGDRGEQRGVGRDGVGRFAVDDQVDE